MPPVTLSSKDIEAVTARVLHSELRRGHIGSRAARAASPQTRRTSPDRSVWNRMGRLMQRSIESLFATGVPRARLDLRNAVKEFSRELGGVLDTLAEFDTKKPDFKTLTGRLTRLQQIATGARIPGHVDGLMTRVLDEHLERLSATELQALRTGIQTLRSKHPAEFFKLPCGEQLFFHPLLAPVKPQDTGKLQKEMAALYQNGFDAAWHNLTLPEPRPADLLNGIVHLARQAQAGARVAARLGRIEEDSEQKHHIRILTQLVSSMLPAQRQALAKNGGMKQLLALRTVLDDYAKTLDSSHSSFSSVQAAAQFAGLLADALKDSAPADADKSAADPNSVRRMMQVVAFAFNLTSGACGFPLGKTRGVSGRFAAQFKKEALHGMEKVAGLATPKSVDGQTLHICNQFAKDLNREAYQILRRNGANTEILPLIANPGRDEDDMAKEAHQTLEELTGGNEKQMMGISQIACQQVGNACFAALKESSELKSPGIDSRNLGRVALVPMDIALTHQISRTKDGSISVRTLHTADPLEKLWPFPIKASDPVGLPLYVDGARSVFRMETEFLVKPDGTIVPGASSRLHFSAVAMKEKDD